MIVLVLDAQRNSSYFDRTASALTPEMSVEKVPSITCVNFTADKTKVDYNSWTATEFHV